MTMDRDVLRAVGGFRQCPGTWTPAAGGPARGRRRVYHAGLGVLRRTAGAATWDTGLGYFLTRQGLAASGAGSRPVACWRTHEPTPEPARVRRNDWSSLDVPALGT